MYVCLTCTFSHVCVCIQIKWLHILLLTIRQQVLHVRPCFIYSEFKVEEVGWWNTQVSCAYFPTILGKHQCCDLKGVFCFGTCICWSGPSGFLDRPNETEYTRMLKWLCHSLSPSFSLLCFSVGHVIFYHKFDCCIWTIAEVDIALHDNFLAASEMFGHIFVFWELSISLSILPDLLCMPVENFKFFTDWHKYNVM